MRIVIDYRPALRARTGVGEHIHQVTRALSETGSDEITVFSSSWKDRLPPDLSTRLHGARPIDRRVPVGVLNLAWHRLEWPSVETLCGQNFDVAHSPHPLMLPARSAAQVITIHDLYFLNHADQTDGEVRRDYPSLARAHAHRADRIIVVSGFVAEEVTRLLEVPADRISVCPNGGPDWTGPRAPLNPDGYLLFVGTLEPRKNVGRLLAAYAHLRSKLPNVPRLVIAGRPASVDGPAASWLDDITRAPLAGHVDYRGYVPEEEREALYKGAQLLVLPSLDEGFGIPALESMAAGVPVVVSNRGALPEVVGDAGLFVDPDDTEALSSAMERILTDASLRTVCAERGLDRARRFTWSDTARNVRRAYAEALERRRRRCHTRHAHRN